MRDFIDGMPRLLRALLFGALTMGIFQALYLLDGERASWASTVACGVVTGYLVGWRARPGRPRSGPDDDRAR